MKEQTTGAIKKQLKWIEFNGLTSYDQYDFWSSKYGQFAKKVYYKNKKAGAMFVAPVFILELLTPSSRKLFTKKKRFPIADAHLILGHVNMFNVTSEKSFLDKAEEIAEHLLTTSISGYAGHCWGYPFDWMTTRGLWTSATPLITSTPYCFEAFLALYDATGDKKYETIARSILEFSLQNLNTTNVGKDMLASSYSPIDHSRVLNASAYRAFVLIEGYKRFQIEEAKILGEQLLNFVLHTQQEDGSWLYGLDHPNDAFIDNFHTCFVLKNLYKSNLVLQRNDIDNAIEKGYKFYKGNLLINGFIPLPFVKVGRINLVKEEMYDYAEGISLGVLVNNTIEGSIIPSEKMIERLINKYQTKQGYFITKVMSMNLTNKIPYLRWPQAQLYYALTNYLVYTSKK